MRLASPPRWHLSFLVVSASNSNPVTDRRLACGRSEKALFLRGDAVLPIIAHWLAGQDTAAGPVSTNQSSFQIPFQRWFKFKEAFSPQFIVDCAASLGKPARSCLDPFGGSGTSALTAQFLGIRPTTIEVNPFLADLIEAKLSTYDVASLRTDYLNVLRISKDLCPATAKLLKDAPATLVKPGINNRWIYSKGVAHRILALREAIALVKSRPNRLLLTVVLGSTLVGLSNVIVNGKGRKYRNDWETRQKSAADVETAFRGSFFEVFSDICLYAGRGSRDFTLIRGDSRTMLDQVEPVDFAVFSPPYPNSFDYTDIYNLELWMLGYLSSRPDNLRLRGETLRSHVQIRREYSTDTSGSKSLTRAYRDLCRVRKKLWNPDIPEMICAYFADLKTVMIKLKTRLNKGGKAFLAVGNSKYAGVTVDTETILQDIALAHGYRRASSRPIRSMRASAQQGGRHELTEALLTFS
jgi:hypothetical protein